MEWLLKNKKKLMGAVMAAVTLALSIAYLVPGDSPDKGLEKAKDAIEQVDSMIPADE